MMIYLASPFFSESQCSRLKRVRSLCLNEGFVVWSAFFDSQPVKPADSEEKRRAGFEENVRRVKCSDIVLAITDEKDMGTCFELACGYMMKKIVIGYAETLGDKPFNLMLAQACDAVVKNEEELKRILAEVKEGEVDRVFQGEIE